MTNRAPQSRAWRSRATPANVPSAPAQGWDIRNAPIHAEDMEPAGIALRWFAGIAFIAYSIITTAIVLGNLLDPLIPGGIDIGVLIPYGFLIGLLVGIGVTVGEWATITKAPRVHWFLVLLCDAPFSAYQTGVWAWIVVTTKLSTDTLPTWGWLVLIGGSLLWGVITAKLGEKLLLKHGGRDVSRDDNGQ